jgi:uncharacterized protein (DUF4213/DUF364 family)
MELNRRLYETFRERAENTAIRTVSVGTGYTAVVLEDGDAGVAFTWIESGGCCVGVEAYRDFEGRPAIELLEGITGNDPFLRSQALALVNALNHRAALALPDDAGNESLLDALEIREGTRVAMVGLIPPLARQLKRMGAGLEVIDLGRSLGTENRFFEKLRSWAEALIMTGTSILNNSTEDVLARAGQGIRVALLGPSTPMAPEAFSHLPVRLLAGSVVMDPEAVLKAVRHGAGTPVLGPFCRKKFARPDLS